MSPLHRTLPAAALIAAVFSAGCARGEDEGGHDTSDAADGFPEPEADNETPADPAPDMDDETTREDDDSWEPPQDAVDVPDAPEVPDAPDTSDTPADTPADPPVEEEVWDAWDPPVDGADVTDIPDVADVPDADGVDAAEEIPSGEVWMEISYQYRSPYESTTTADWSCSPTPSWTEAQWAPEGSSWPYIHVPDGGSLTSDPIGGTVLGLGCYDRFRLFFGLEELSHVDRATVTLEGRSLATSAGVDIEVWNPGAGSSIVSYASMSQDWTADIVTVDFTAEAGNGFQAVEVAPVGRSCSLALRRVRLTLYGIY